MESRFTKNPGFLVNSLPFSPAIFVGYRRLSGHDKNKQFIDSLPSLSLFHSLARNHHASGSDSSSKGDVLPTNRRFLHNTIKMIKTTNKIPTANTYIAVTGRSADDE